MPMSFFGIWMIHVSHIAFHCLASGWFLMSLFGFWMIHVQNSADHLGSILVGHWHGRTLQRAWGKGRRMGSGKVVSSMTFTVADMNTQKTNTHFGEDAGWVQVRQSLPNPSLRQTWILRKQTPFWLRGECRMGSGKVISSMPLIVADMNTQKQILLRGTCSMGSGKVVSFNTRGRDCHFGLVGWLSIGSSLAGTTHSCKCRFRLLYSCTNSSSESQCRFRLLCTCTNPSKCRSSRHWVRAQTVLPSW